MSLVCHPNYTHTDNIALLLSCCFFCLASGSRSVTQLSRMGNTSVTQSFVLQPRRARAILETL
eukprot:197521-Pyramimonas_sp.AAC.1